MKILMSALACEPGKGSELEVGYRAMLAAASQHEVWVLSNRDTVPAVLRAIQYRPEGSRIHVEGIDFGVGAEGIDLLTIPGFHFYYDRWQRRAARRAVELDKEVNFDVVHHATLAAYWTRTGVAVLDKPLVWGPVGGGVEPPLSLLGELGWRGLLEDAGRVITRRLLGRLGPARLAQRRADVVFAQNADTLRRIRTAGRMSILTNATAVDFEHRQSSGGARTSDVLVVGRLVAWKGAMLALRAFRHIRHDTARLVFCGQGYERTRLQRAAERWGIAERVCFEGWMPRQTLLARMAGAGALLHPALHEEAGLCVAEALALGTPAVCLDHGGPAEILRQWPDTASAAVPPGDPEETARGLSRALDRFLSDPPPVPAAPRASATSFQSELLAGYETAVRMWRRAGGRSMVWAFPRGKPQLFSESPRGLSQGVLVYGFGRRIPRLVQRGVALQVRVPGLRHWVTECRRPVEPSCGWETWDVIAAKLSTNGTGTSREWLHLHSQWDKPRSSAIGLNARGEAEFFLTIEPLRERARGPLHPVTSFRVPACTASFVIGEWSVRQFQLLPQFHRPASWDPVRIRRVASEVSEALAGALHRPPGIPDHWRPMHGDLVPWNLREDDAGQLWLMDWEDAGWGPPLADLMRFILADQSLASGHPDRIAARVRQALASEPREALEETARFWLQHRNLRPLQTGRDWPRQMARDVARGAREFAALRVLASADVGPVPVVEHTSR